jgi:O-antigen ligase
VFSRLDRLANLPPSPSLRVAVLAYLAHIVCEGWIGSAEAFLAIALIAAIVAWRKGELRVPFHPLYLPLGLFVAASFASVLVSPRSMASLLASDDWPAALTFPFVSSGVPPLAIQPLIVAGEWFPLLTLPLAIALYANVSRLPRLALGAAMALAVLQSSLGLTQFFLLGHNILERRITGTTAHVMTFSGILLPLALLLLSAGFSREGSRAQRIVALLATFTIALTFTRNAWIGWAAGFLLLVALRRIKLVPWLVPLALLAVTFSPEPIFARLVSSFDLKQTSVLDRIRMAEAGVEMIRDHPLFGIGPGNMKEVYPLYRKPDAPRFRIPHLHNNPIQIWAERGLLAFLAWIALIAVFLREAGARARRALPGRSWLEGGIAGAVALTVAGLFEFNFGDTEVLLTMLDVWALALALGGALDTPAGQAASPGESPAPGPA